VVSAAVGVVGLEATYEAVKLGKTVALSNKESSGRSRANWLWLRPKKPGANCCPWIANTNAVHQCLRGGTHGEVRRLVLTASGGPFRKTGRLAAAGANVTTEQALAHPNWRMGNRITIDSATMMKQRFRNHRSTLALWHAPGPNRCPWSIPSPRSIPCVEFVDGSVLKRNWVQADMRSPSNMRLTYPERIASNQMAPGFGRS